MLIELNETLTMHDETCPGQDAEGCQCERNAKQAKLICSLAKCPDVAGCSSPLKPTDHCCYDFCGAIINVQKPWEVLDLPFNMQQAKQELQTLLRPSKAFTLPHHKAGTISCRFWICILSEMSSSTT